MDPEVYDQLTGWLRPKESYGDCLRRLLKVVDSVSSLHRMLDRSVAATRADALEREMRRES